MVYEYADAPVEDLVSENREQTFESMSDPSILYDAKDAPVPDNDNTVRTVMPSSYRS
jgi:hypothetical protein